MYTIRRNVWTGWSEDITVKVEKIIPPAFFDSAYQVFADGESVGYVASRSEKYHTTLWAYTIGEPHDMSVPCVSRRTSAIEALLTKSGRDT